MLNIPLSVAEGVLFPVQTQTENGPIMSGQLTFTIGEGEKAPTLRLETACWIKETKPAEGQPSKRFYSLSIGGINGALFPETEKKSEKAPDYTGTMGPNRELRIAAWRRSGSESGKSFLSLIVEPHQQSGKQPGSGSKQSSKTGANAGFL